MEREEYIKMVDTYGDTVYRIALSSCRNRSDAEDITQNVFIKLFQSETEFQDEEHVRKWLIRVASNESKNLCKSFWKKKMLPLEEVETVGQVSFLSSENSLLYDAVMELPDKYRLVVHLYYYEDYPVREIAELLQIKETTVQTRLMRARRKLKEKLEEDCEDEEIIQGHI